MKNLFNRLLSDVHNQPVVEMQPQPSSIGAGQVYSFKTRPFSEFSPPHADRFAAIKIIGVTEGHVVVAVLRGVWSATPTMQDVRTASVLNEYRFAHTGRSAIFGVNREWWTPHDDLDQFNFIATLSVSRAEQSSVDAIASFAPGSTYGLLSGANYAAEGEWRWANDHEAFVLEIERKTAKAAAERAAKEERYRTRLSKLTWDQLRSETQFDNWTPSPPFPPENFTEAARETIRSACDALEALGPKPRKADVRAILKNAVVWFNEAEERAGGVIETEEREDICAVLEEMAHLARQKMLVDEIDEWREW